MQDSAEALSSRIAQNSRCRWITSACAWRTRTGMHQARTLWTDRSNMMENKLDGNAAAGTLQAIFPFEMTLAQVTCTSCDNVLIRVAQVRGRHLLDMRGVHVLLMKEG